MADWIWNSAMEKGISELTIDFLNDSVEPKELEIKPILAYLSDLRETIKKTLRNEKFDSDFIVSGKFEIFISKKYESMKLLSCTATLIDKEGKSYIGKTYTEKAYEDKFKVFRENLIDKIKRAFK